MVAYCYELFSILPVDQLKAHFNIDLYHDSVALMAAIRLKNYSTILLDFNLDLLKDLQSNPHYNGCPIIISAPEDQEEQRLEALSAGAHDVFTKQMNVQELILKIRNKQRSFFQMNNVFSLGNVSMVFSELKTYLHGKPIDLTLIEMKILRLLIKKYPAIVSKEELIEDVWPSQKILPTTINTHIYNLRSKFERWEFEVITIKSQGYTLALKQNNQH